MEYWNENLELEKPRIMPETNYAMVEHVNDIETYDGCVVSGDCFDERRMEMNEIRVDSWNWHQNDNYDNYNDYFDYENYNNYDNYDNRDNYNNYDDYDNNKNYDDDDYNHNNYDNWW